MRKLAYLLLRPRKQWLWHPESPGMKVLVVRTWIGRLLRNGDFASIFERWHTDSQTLPPLYRSEK